MRVLHCSFRCLSFLIFSFVYFSCATSLSAQESDYELIDVSEVIGTRVKYLDALSSNGRIAAVSSDSEAYLVDLVTGKKTQVAYPKPIGGGFSPKPSIIAVNNSGVALIGNRNGRPALGSAIYRDGKVTKINYLPEDFTMGIDHKDQNISGDFPQFIDINNRGTIIGNFLLSDQRGIVLGFRMRGDDAVPIRAADEEDPTERMRKPPTSTPPGPVTPPKEEPPIRHHLVYAIDDYDRIYGGVQDIIGPESNYNKSFTATNNYDGYFITGTSYLSSYVQSRVSAVSGNGAYLVGQVSSRVTNRLLTTGDALYAGRTGGKIISPTRGGWVTFADVNNSGVASGGRVNGRGYEVFLFNGTKEVNLTPAFKNPWYLTYGSIPLIGDNGNVVGVAIHGVQQTVYVLRASSDIEFVDPNYMVDPQEPDSAHPNGPAIYPSRMIPGSTLPSDPTKLLSGRQIIGAATDGVTEVVIKWPVNGPGTAKITIKNTDEGSTVQTGSMSTVGGAQSTLGYTSLDVPAQKIRDRWYVTALYTSPQVFERTSADLSLESRSVTVTGVFTPSSGGLTSTKEKTLHLRRPPILFLHGLWSARDTWRYDFMRHDPRFTWYAENYRSSNDQPFARNIIHARTGAQNALHIFRSRHRSAASQVTVVGHSMGGILARLHAGNRQRDYYREDNLGQGDFYKFIAIYSPMLGSGMACRLSGSQSSASASRDLRPDSLEIANLPAIYVPTHVIAGVGGEKAIHDPFQDRLRNLYSLMRGHPLMKLAKVMMYGFTYEFARTLGSVDHDSIVAKVSALAGLQGAATTIIDYRSYKEMTGLHVGVNSDNAFADEVLLPLIIEDPRSPVFSPGLPSNRALRIPVPQVCSSGLPTPTPTPYGPFSQTLSLSVERSVTLADVRQNAATISVYAGSNLKIKVDSSKPAHSVIISSAFGEFAITSAPQTIEIPIPADLMGEFSLEAVGKNKYGDTVTSNKLTLSVLQKEPLLALQVNPSELVLGCKEEEEEIEVNGIFRGGIPVELTEFTAGVTYTSLNPEIAVVTGKGRVVAKSNGTTSILVSYGTHQERVQVTVSSSLCPGYVSPALANSPTQEENGDSSKESVLSNSTEVTSVGTPSVDLSNSPNAIVASEVNQSTTEIKMPRVKIVSARLVKRSRTRYLSMSWRQDSGSSSLASGKRMVVTLTRKGRVLYKKNISGEQNTLLYTLSSSQSISSYRGCVENAAGKDCASFRGK